MRGNDTPRGGFSGNHRRRRSVGPPRFEKILNLDHYHNGNEEAPFRHYAIYAGTTDTVTHKRHALFKYRGQVLHLARASAIRRYRAVHSCIDAGKGVKPQIEHTRCTN